MEQPTESSPGEGSEIILDDSRFDVSRKVLLTDGFMTWFIKFGGVMVVAAVIGIFVFITSQVLPLFKGASVELDAATTTTEALPKGNYLGIAADEWMEKPLAIRDDGKFIYSDLVTGEVLESEFDFLEGDKMTALRIESGEDLIVAGTESGQVHLIEFSYSPTFKDGVRTVNEDLNLAFTGEFNGPVTKVSCGQSGDSRLIAVLTETEEGPHLELDLVQRKKSLISAGDWKEVGKTDLTETLRSDVAVQEILVTNRADAVLVVFENGEIDYHFRSGSGLNTELRQTFQPFADLNEKKIKNADFLLGDVSLVLTSPEGVNRLFSLYRSEEEPTRMFHQTKEFPALPDTPAFYSPSFRNKAFLTGTSNTATLRYATTETIRWESELPWEVTHALISRKSDSLLFLTEDRHFVRVPVDDPHPEAGIKAFFGKQLYEGSSEAKYEWQSTGGSDDFEAKLSLIPLIFGTLKGTFYAMLFAVPIALFGAIYTAEFLDPKNKVFIKPAMEVMASLPSVVLGFLAALWLAPMIEDRVPSVLCIVVLVPLGAFLFGMLWSRQPRNIKKYVREGYEFLYFAPIMLILLFLGWQMGPLVESLIFTVKDPNTGERVGDFARWWPSITGTAYEQRNSLVVGFMMGFAVIPIVFTIAEDSLSNVPDTLRTGSLALGASRWQTAWRIVLPTASAGILSAIMIGLGRAVGETMIVVMATGNTPIMEWNIFSGMRTLSANIAVELPEAPHHGTLYRTLFLGAVVLFLMTFLVNTIAEVLRQHLREKYKTV
ncbi:MAG: ABC transporter permease subunit [Verrucomicrobiales bacterium]|nr:ABC transporter permease subunit [Verrucomicrobiales bacterium]